MFIDLPNYSRRAIRRWMHAIRNCKESEPYHFSHRKLTFCFFSLTRLEAELTRLNRNKERRFAREKQKGIGRTPVGDSEEAGTPSKSGGTTTRKCANCGLIGHIKTNKKYLLPSFLSSFAKTIRLLTLSFFRLCPKLNGSAPPDDGVTETAFSMAASSTF
jgi:transcription initiation factor TFIID subunit 1, fungi type